MPPPEAFMEPKEPSEGAATALSLAQERDVAKSTAAAEEAKRARPQREAKERQNKEVERRIAQSADGAAL